MVCCTKCQNQGTKTKNNLRITTIYYGSLISNITRFILVGVFILQIVSISVCEENVGDVTNGDLGKRFGPPVTEEDREECIKNGTFKEMGRMKDYLTPGYQDFISSIRLTWAGSVECCITHHMELLPYVSLRTREKYGQLTGHAWINTNDIVKEGQWLWPDGREVVDELWDQDQWVSDSKNPNNEKGEEHCGQMLVNFKSLVTLNDALCSIKHFFICRRRTLPTKERPPSAKTIKHLEKLRNEVCDQTIFTAINERDFLSSTKLDWHGAFDCCKNRNWVLLLSLKQETKLDFQNIKERVWVGVSDLVKQEIDIWPERDEENHRPWLSHTDLHEFGREEGCPVIHHGRRKDREEDDIFLNDLNCHIALAFVCQIKPAKSFLGEEGPGSRSLGARIPIINSHHSESGEDEEQTCSNDFSKIDHSDFKISNFKLSEANASECCSIHHGALLGTILSNKNLSTRVWTDIKYKKELSAFVWSHNGQVVDKHLWLEAPNYGRDKTDCASLVMHEGNHKLRVTDCQQKLHFICYPLKKKPNVKHRGRTAIDLSNSLADANVPSHEVELCKETQFSPLISDTILVSNTKLKWERAKECCGYFHMYLYFSFDSSQMTSLARLISKPAWISQIVPNSTVRNIQKMFKLLSKPFEVKTSSACNALAPSSSTHKTSNSTLINCNEHLHFICQDFRMCETEHFPGLHLSSIWKTEPEYAVVDRDNIRAVKEELFHLRTLSPLPKIPMESYKYLQWSRRIFSKICPEYPVAQFLVKSISRHFRRFLYHHYDDYHSHRDHKVEIHRHQRILKSLHKCYNETEPFTFTMEMTKEFCSRQTCNFKVADKNSSSSNPSPNTTATNTTKPKLYCECNEKILEVTINSSYAYNVSSRTLEKLNLHFDLGLVDLVVEFIWKVILFSHYLCAEYFIDSDLSFMYDELETLFDPIMLFRWENLNVQENKFWESLYPTYELTSFSDGVDACVSGAINISQYQPLLLRPTQFIENANDKAIKLMKTR